MSPLYGVTIEGSNFYDAFVTSFTIIYSSDGNKFHKILSPGTQQEKVVVQILTSSSYIIINPNNL